MVRVGAGEGVVSQMTGLQADSAWSLFVLLHSPKYFLQKAHINNHGPVWLNATGAVVVDSQ